MEVCLKDGETAGEEIYAHREDSAAVKKEQRRAAKAARKEARMHGTPIWIEENGKIVAVKP